MHRPTGTRESRVVSFLMRHDVGKIMLFILLVASSLWAFQTGKPKQPGRIICRIPRGKVVKMVKPVYPPNAAAHGIAGKVKLTVLVNELGEPTKVEVTEGNPMFAEASLDAVKQWRWKPLRLNGEAPGGNDGHG